MARRAKLPPVIVIGLDSLPGLQTARIFARHGIPVIAVAGNRKHHNCRTRVCKSIVYADCRSDAFVETLESMPDELVRGAVLVPCIDAAVLAISKHRSRLEGKYRLSLCDDQTVRLLSNKVSFYEYTGKHGFLIPETVFLRQRADAVAAASRFKFPGVLKPSIRLPKWDAHTPLKAIRVDSGAELLARYDECRSLTDLLILQQWIEGGDDSLFSFNGYFNAASEPLATFIAKKIRQWPPHVGFSSMGEECRDDFVLAESVRLFQVLGYRGLVYMEFKRDANDGRRYMIEANVGRPTGRSAIAEAGGVEILFTMYCDILGLPLPDARIQTYGNAKWIDLRHDLQSAFYYWRRGELSIRDWARSWRGRKAYAYFSWTDPLPFLFDLIGVARIDWRTRRRSGSAGASLVGSARGTPPS